MKDNKKVILKKENGIVSQVEERPKFVDEEGALLPHLCGEDCKNASPLTCSKFAHRVMREIGEYDQVVDGYQIIKNGEVVKFRVTSCKDYVEAVPTDHSYSKRRELMNSIYTNYYDAETVEEALEIQADILRRQRERSKSRR